MSHLELVKWLHNTIGLLFLNPEGVSDCFVGDFMSKCPIDERLQKFADYFTETCTSELTRTTISCESFHA